MSARFSHLRWGLVLKAAVLIYIATLILGLVISVPLLAVLNWWRLDASSAIQASSVITVLLVVVVTGIGAWWVARGAEHAALLHGFLVGLVVALLSLALDTLFLRSIGLEGVVFYLLMVAAGLLGGVVTPRRRARS